MAITREKKEEIIKDLHEKADKSKMALFLNFRGLSVNDTTALRREFRKAGADMKVAKKTLLKKVFGGMGYSGEMPALDGEAAVVFGYEESPEPARIVKNFSKKKQGISVLGGVFEGKFVFADFMERLASLPSREVLLGQFVGVVNSPLRAFVSVAAGPVRNLVVIISQLRRS